MKKGLLTVLLASLVLVGCQNYDDQFDDLNAQISALKSQVDGLSSLSGQVSSLAGTISGLQSGISAATAAATAAGTAATAAGASADANATAIAAATAAATAAGASADAATAAAEAATTAATEAVAAGATNATAIAAATAAATAAGVSADAATAAAEAATTAASSAASATDLTALSASLTALAADVAAVQASLATAATAEAVTALQAEIDAIEADLDDLLSSSNVYATAISITSAADMAAALALGNKVALMNETITITDNAAIADADIQTFINRVKTITKAFSYSSGTATGFTPTFDELTSAKAITITAAGDISFAKLTSATDIVVHDDFETKITSFSMPLLASVSGIDTDEAGVVDTDALNLDSATSIDLGSLARYGAAFQVKMKEGGTLDIASLDDVDADGDQSDLALTINGPDSLTLTKIEGGALSLTNVSTANISGLYSAITVNGGVKDLTVTKGVSIDLSGADDLVTANLNLVNSYDADFTTATAALAAKGNDVTYTANLATIAAPQLTTLTLTGNWLDLTIDSGESNLTTLSIDGTFDDLSIIGAPDLTTLTVSDDTAFGDLTLQNNPNLVVADFDNSFSGAADGTTAATSSTVSVTGNASLEKLHWAADDVGSLTVTGNAKLAELDFTGLADDGAATSPVVYVYNNNLTAVKATDADDGDTEAASGATGDLGTFDAGTSGMKTLSTYLGHVDGATTLGAYVSFDTVSTSVNNENDADSTTLNVTFQDATTWNAATVMYKTNKVSTTAPTGATAQKSKRSYLLDISAITSAQFTVGSQDVLDINGDGAPAAYTFTGQTQAAVVAALNNANNKALATAAGVTMNAYTGGNSQLAIHIGSQLNSALWETSNATASNLNLTASDVISVQVGNQTVTLTAPTQTYEVYSVAKSVGAAIATRWAAVNTSTSALIFNVTGTVAQASSTIDGDTGHMLTFTSKDVGTGGEGLTASISLSALDSTGNNGVLPVSYGATSLTTDNTSTGADVVLTFESNTAGTIANVIGNPATSATSGTFSAATLSHAATGIAGITELHSNYVVNTGTGSRTSTDGQYDESWNDVRMPYGDNYAANETVSTAAVALKSRLGWL
jgi:hypothetical protein